MGSRPRAAFLVHPHPHPRPHPHPHPQPRPQPHPRPRPHASSLLLRRLSGVVQGDARRHAGGGVTQKPLQTQEVSQRGVRHNRVRHDGARHDGAIHDGAIHDRAIHDGAIHECKALHVQRRSQRIGPRLHVTLHESQFSIRRRIFNYSERLTSTSTLSRTITIIIRGMVFVR